MSSFSENAALGYLKSQVKIIKLNYSSRLLSLLIITRDRFLGCIQRVPELTPLTTCHRYQWRPRPYATYLTNKCFWSDLLELWLPAGGPELPDSWPAYAAQPGNVPQAWTIFDSSIYRASLSIMGAVATYWNLSLCAGYMDSVLVFNCKKRKAKKMCSVWQIDLFCTFLCTHYILKKYFKIQ